MRWQAGNRIKAELMLRAWLVLLLLFFAQGTFFIVANSQTVDEANNIAAGYSYLSKRDFRLNPEHPPLIKEFQALPLFLWYRLPFAPDPQQWRQKDTYSIGYNFLYRSPMNADQILLLNRLPNLLLGGLLIALAGWWAYRLWGSGAAIVALMLGCFEPNIIAHSSLATNDIGVTLFVFLAVYLLWEYTREPKRWISAATGLAAGAAVVSKYSGLFLVPITGLIIALGTLCAKRPSSAPTDPKDPKQRKKNLVQGIGLFLLIWSCAIPVILAAYFFQGFTAWFTGLQEFLALMETGRPAFFFGKYSDDGWWNYFILSFIIKTPIGSLILIALSLLFFRAGTRLGRHEARFLLLPPLVVFIATTQARLNIGLRHILVVYPFLFVLASRLTTVRFGPRWFVPSLLAVPLVFTAFSSLRVAPHQLAYFNEFVGGAGEGYRYLSDSNLDWGQDLKGVKAYMTNEKLPIIYLSYFGTASPSYYGIRYHWAPSTWPTEWPLPQAQIQVNGERKVLAISVYNLQDVWSPNDPLFRWLWSRKPVAKIGYSIFVYDLTGDRDGQGKLAEAYSKLGFKAP